MIRIINGAKGLTRFRRAEYPEEIYKTVRDIVDDVRENGDAALLAYTRKFDAPSLESLRVTKEEIESALSRVDADFIETLKIAKQNITEFHAAQKRNGYEIKRSDGTIMGVKVSPLDSVGAYIPGGTAAYPSSVLMTMIPAEIAGVSRRAIATPAGRDGKVSDCLLAAASIVGVDEIYKMGGAQAVAAFAYGTESVNPVDKIVGPGNIYMTLAKKQVYGDVGIDMIAGPSEILIIADETANPVFVAADMLSQAEHDPMASAILITNSKSLAVEVAFEIEKQLATLPRVCIARHSIEENGRVYIVSDIPSAIAASNAYAPEHLEICVKNPLEWLDGITSAGSIFLGNHTPESLADYMAGTNHVLPTGGGARFFSPLSVDDFIKKSSYLCYTEDALLKINSRVADFARREGLEAHARSALIRGENAE